MAGEHGDFVRDAVALVAHELMEAEVVRHEALSDRAGSETRRRTVAAARRS